MPPVKSFPVLVIGDSNSVIGDSVRVTAYSGSTARGTVTGVLNSSKEVLLDFGNVEVDVSMGDTLVATINGSSLGGASTTANTSGSGAEITVVTAAIAFPSRSL